jgi:hypothetical protein
MGCIAGKGRFWWLKLFFQNFNVFPNDSAKAERLGFTMMSGS